MADILDEMKERLLGKVFEVRVVRVSPRGLEVEWGRRKTAWIPVDEMPDEDQAHPEARHQPGETLRAWLVGIGYPQRVLFTLRGVPEDESPRRDEPATFEELFDRYRRESRARISQLRKNITSKGGSFR